MRKTLLLLLAALIAVGLGACKEKEKSKDIITKMPQKVKQQTGPRVMASGKIPDKTISWAGGEYTISIDREADKDLPLIEDASGNKYYDNTVHLRITRKDGTTFFDKVFSRRDFAKYTDFNYAKNWGLTGFNFDTVEGNNILFAIAIGSPDEMADDEFVPITLCINMQGETSVRTQNTGADENDDDAPDEKKTEDELSEEEGV